MKKISLILQKTDNPEKLARFMIWESQRAHIVKLAQSLGYKVAQIPTKDASHMTDGAMRRFLGTPEVLYRKVPIHRGRRGEDSEFHHLPPDEYNREDTRENRGHDRF